MQRVREENREALPANWAEWLLDLGKSVSNELRRGAGIEEVSTRIESNTDTCKLGLVFYKSGDVVKVRAMVEDWSRERLIRELGGIHRHRLSKQGVGTP